MTYKNIFVYRFLYVSVDFDLKDLVIDKLATVVRVLLNNLSAYCKESL